MIVTILFCMNKWVSFVIGIYKYNVFTNTGTKTLTVAGSGVLDVLIVGGGGCYNASAEKTIMGGNRGSGITSTPNSGKCSFYGGRFYTTKLTSSYYLFFHTKIPVLNLHHFSKLLYPGFLIL